MATMSVQLRTLPDTRAAVGRSGAHTVVVDRPDGKAGGQGLGFNGGELLALAIGGCLCNDLQYVAHEMGVELASIAIDVHVTFEGSPALATSASVTVNATAHDGYSVPEELIRKAIESSTVSNSIQRGVTVRTNVGSIAPAVRPS
ncbi:OsmC family protein [Ancylobacter sp.]|uniref:OsmC family protein n=1 Tax=Ancylobacter sp. TaxID=1872567 RepID=UPI003D0A3B7A